MNDLQRFQSQDDASPVADPESLSLDDPSFDPASNPVVQAILDEQVLGTTFTPADLQNPALAGLVKNARSLVKRGLGLYTSPSGKVGALFNPAAFRIEEIRAADVAGKLEKLLPPVSKLLPQLGAAAQPAAAAPVPQGSATSAPVSAGAQTALAQGAVAGAKQAQKRPPYPGAGSTLNRLAR